MSVRPSACNNSAPTGRIFTKFDMSTFRKYVEKIQGLYNLTILTDTSRVRPKYTYDITLFERGTAVAQWLRCCATNQKVAGSIPAGVSGFFVGIKSFRSYYGTGVDSASNRNE